MSIILTEEQRQAIAQSPSSPPRVVDPASSTTYVLVRAEVYEHLLALLAEDDVRQMEPLLAELAPEDWEDAATYEAKQP